MAQSFQPPKEVIETNTLAGLLEQAALILLPLITFTVPFFFEMCTKIMSLIKLIACRGQQEVLRSDGQNSSYTTHWLLLWLVTGACLESRLETFGFGDCLLGLQTFSSLPNRREIAHVHSVTPRGIRGASACCLHAAGLWPQPLQVAL